MQSDSTISGLINLFALLSARYNSHEGKCSELLSNYLGYYFGIATKNEYLGLFQDLLEIYRSENVDTESIVLSISSKIKAVIETRDQQMLLLRVMEFCKNTSDQYRVDDIIKRMGQVLGMDEEMLSLFNDYVENRTGDKVKIQRFEGYDGYFRTMWMEADHYMVVTYVGTNRVVMNDAPMLSDVFYLWQESGVVKNDLGAPLYFSSVYHIYQPTDSHRVEFQGENINFRYPNSDMGTHNFSFCVHSGELVAIMGGSGTGKTTLLSLLNGTLAPQQGQLTINGLPTSDARVKSLIGFVPQDDLLIEELTVYQNLYYTARLCFDGMTKEEIGHHVDSMLTELGLEAAKHLKVGSPLNKTISGGQRKRLNIALELIREPAVLMLDEPTSGLSSADTENVLALLKQQTYKGRLVILNIHQPSSDVYKLFDRLWLLDKGGYPVYDGNPIDAITYFKREARHADADVSACPYCGNVKPETVLNIIDAKILDNMGRMSNTRRTTPQQWHELYLKQQAQTRKQSQEQPQTAAQQAGSIKTELKTPGKLKQFWIQTERNLMTKLTNTQYMLITLLEAPLLAVICAWLTRYVAETGYTLQENKNFVSFLFMSVIVATFTGMIASAETIIRDRALLKREKFLQLSYGAYITSKIGFLVVVSLLQTALYIFVGQRIMGFNDMFVNWWLILFATAFVANLTGMLLSQCLSSVVAIYITIPLLLIPQILLCGLVVNFDDLNPRSTTGNVPLIGNVIPSRWAFEALAVTTFVDNEYEKPLFALHKEKYQNEYDRWVYLYELEAQLETLRDEQTKGKPQNPQHMQVIATELPRLAQKAGLKPYQGDSSYQHLKEYFEQAEKVFNLRGNQATLAADKIVTERIKQMGRESHKLLRNNYTNDQLETVLTNSLSTTQRRVVEGHVVPMVGAVYLDPPTHNANAPFYSSCKYVGNVQVPTMWLNLMVLALMAILTATLIYTDCPGRYLRKE